MRNPDPPHLEIGFYFRQKTGRQALGSLATALLETLGAVPKKAQVIASHSESLCRAMLTAGHTMAIQNRSQFEELLGDPSRFVTKITLNQGTRIISDALEYVVVLPSDSVNNAVAIWVEGEAFSTPASKAISRKQKRIAVKTLSAFRTLVSHLDPTYATITFDYGLETPDELLKDGRSLAFRDFYLSRKDFGEDFLANLRSRFPGSYHEANAEGQITLTYSAFRFAAGDTSYAEDPGYDLSPFVAKNIASTIT